MYSGNKEDQDVYNEALIIAKQKRNYDIIKLQLMTIKACAKCAADDLGGKNATELNWNIHNGALMILTVAEKLLEQIEARNAHFI